MPFQFSNAPPCECDWLGRAAADPHVPVDFDGYVHEYHIGYDGPNGRTKMVLRYCPFCGGAAPKSRRSEFFTRLTHGEISRLNNLTRGLQTLEEVVEALGPPDDDLNPGDGTGRWETSESPPTFEFCRTLVYQSLSETAVVRASERGDGTVRFSFAGKPVRSPPKGPITGGDGDRGAG